MRVPQRIVVGLLTVACVVSSEQALSATKAKPAAKKKPSTNSKTKEPGSGLVVTYLGQESFPEAKPPIVKKGKAAYDHGYARGAKFRPNLHGSSGAFFFENGGFQYQYSDSGGWVKAEFKDSSGRSFVALDDASDAVMVVEITPQLATQLSGTLPITSIEAYPTHHQTSLGEVKLFPSARFGCDLKRSESMRADPLYDGTDPWVGEPFRWIFTKQTYDEAREKSSAQQVGGDSGLDALQRFVDPRTTTRTDGSQEIRYAPYMNEKGGCSYDFVKRF